MEYRYRYVKDVGNDVELEAIDPSTGEVLNTFVTSEVDRPTGTFKGKPIENFKDQQAADKPKYVYEIKKRGPEKSVIVFEVKEGKETQIYQGNPSFSATEQVLIEEAIIALENQYPGVKDMTPKSGAPPAASTGPTYVYEIKQLGFDKLITVYEIGPSGEKQIYEGNPNLATSDDILKSDFITAFKDDYPGVVNMTPKTPSTPTTTVSPDNGNYAFLNDDAQTKITGALRDKEEVEMATTIRTQIGVQARAQKNGRTYIAGGYLFNNGDTENIQREIWGRLYDDIRRQIFDDDIRREEDSGVQPTTTSANATEAAEDALLGITPNTSNTTNQSTGQSLDDRFPSGYQVLNINFKFTQVDPDKPKPKETPPPPPPPSDPPVPKRDTELTYYIPKSRITEPQSAQEGEFLIKDTGEPYQGSYIETYKGTYFAGKTPEENGVELVPAEENPALERRNVLGGNLDLLLLNLAIAFKPSLSDLQKLLGKATRHFVQNKKTGKIVETDEETAQQISEQVSGSLPNYAVASVEWVTKGPAEDKIVNGYPYEGAESKNRKAIETLEKQIPGISTFVTNYAELVVEPVSRKANAVDTKKVEEKPLTDELGNLRKASFDTKI
jgi:hypothetical protein